MEKLLQLCCWHIMYTQFIATSFCFKYFFFLLNIFCQTIQSKIHSRTYYEKKNYLKKKFTKTTRLLKLPECALYTHIHISNDTCTMLRYDLNIQKEKSKCLIQNVPCAVSLTRKFENVLTFKGCRFKCYGHCDTAIVIFI